MRKKSHQNRYPISIVDVFAEQPLAGNQLAVVHDAADLTADQMLSIARETNFSETTFVTSHAHDQAEVRIFTPVQELPFAGHPTVGTAWELAYNSGSGSGDITLNLPVGPVAVSFDNAGIGWMTPPEVTFHGSFDVTRAASLVGLTPADVSAGLPVELAEVGPRFLLLPVRDLAALQRSRLNGDMHQQLLDEGLPVNCVFVFSDSAYTQDAHYAARMFFNSGGVREDAATGSANTAFAAYLKKHLGLIGDVVVEQGVEIQRPSRLYLRVAETIQVGGKVQPVISGELTV